MGFTHCKTQSKEYHFLLGVVFFVLSLFFHVFFIIIIIWGGGGWLLGLLFLSGFGWSFFF
jgi:hypothetical protein